MTKKEYILLNWYPTLPSAWKNKEEVRITRNKRGNYIGDADGIPHYLPGAEVENNPIFWVEVRKRTYVDDIIDEPSRTWRRNYSAFYEILKEEGQKNLEAFKILSGIESEPKEPILYTTTQRRSEFLDHFGENGWELYRTNTLFHHITNHIMRGASMYDMMLDVILKLDDIAHVSNFIQKTPYPTHHETK